MAQLRPRDRQVYSGFTAAEVERMEKLYNESDEPLMPKEICQKLARSFNSSGGRAGKPIVKWTEVQNWFDSRQQQSTSKPASSTDASRDESALPKSCPSNTEKDNSQFPRGEAGNKVLDPQVFEFEARSAKDCAWYDVEMFLTHRYTLSGEAEVLVRFVGFGAEEDEWVNVKERVRLRSIPYDNTECHKVNTGDSVLCFQERLDQAIHFDARVLEVQRRIHDIRGCRCLFLIRYDHDDSEERVWLRRLCGRPF